MKGSKKRLFKQEYAAELLRIAQGDFESATNLFKSSKTGRPENAVFLAQQSVEKAVKSVLVHLQIPFPMVHDLGIILALLPDKNIPPNGFDLIALNPFASVRRYEEGQLPLSKSEVRFSLGAAKQVLIWANKLVFEKNSKRKIVLKKLRK